jgi:hypothetical protein
MTLAQYYIEKIDEDLPTFFTKHPKSTIKYIYAGVTEDKIENRMTQHIDDKQPKQCKKGNWVIEKISSLKIKKEGQTEKYKKNIGKIEQHLIDELDKFYGKKCVNDRNEDETIGQRGGAGVTDLSINVGDTNTFYIFYCVA